MLDKIKDFFGITGGAYTEICRQIEELESQGKDEKYLRAELNYRKLHHDMMYSPNGALEHEIDNQELIKIGEIVQEGNRIEEERKKRITELKAQKTQLEQEIVKLRREKIRLEAKPQGPHDEEIGRLNNQIKWYLYEVQRDKAFIMSKISDIESQASELEYKHNLCTGKNDPVKLELAIEISELKLQRDSLILNEWKPAQKAFEEKLLQVEEWRRQIAALESSSDSTKLEGIKNILIELIGGTK